ncbi:hypothetical protein BJY04DRAFT_220530 [Aspergillus karnatakaensis]|uniref:peptidase family M20/M25/M40 protein n=1 Tax=Aspergillus karnatakaensis TaxID=1810916 RepID=UPI003CCCEB32
MSLDNQPTQPSVGERRGHQIAPLQTNFSRPTSQIVNVASPLTQRPRPSEFENGNAERVPLQPAHVKRQSSRSSLRHIFSREKPARKSPDAKLSGIEEVQDSVQQNPAEPAVPLSPSDCATPRAIVSTPTTATASMSTNSSRSKLQQKSRTKTDEDDLPPAEDVAWKPPPLFKAYPQGLKHATLAAPLLSGDSIIRLHATFKARGASLQDDDQANQPANEEPTDDNSARKKKLDKEKQKYIRALSDNIENGEWTRRVYVLATTGYILQYAGEGKHDRLPEKMLLLGPKSVAFASDAIPGKHWVLQVSQGSEEESSTNSPETSRPIFSRFGFHRSHSRRLARNLLLVFNDPDEMSSWLLAVRAQIETRGGKEYVSEKVYDEDMEGQLRTTPGMRQMVKRDPNRFSTVLLQPRQSMVFDDKDSSGGDQSRRSSYISIHRRSMVMQPTPESRSGSVSTAHTDTMSNGEDTARFYSAVGSPPLPDKSVISEAASVSSGPISPTLASPRKRQSMFLPQMANSDISEMPRAQSTVPDAQSRSTSPPAPNFSVPVFSKRFAARPDVPHVPNLPSIPGDIHRDDTSIDAVSMFSSPPQSPGREFFIAPIETREQRRPLDRRDVTKKQLRASNSEDALGNTSREPDRGRFRYSQLPEHLMMGPSPSNFPRPITGKSTVSNGTPSSTKLPTGAVNTTTRRERPSGADTPSRPSSLVMSRRKSVNGLTIGPPAAPPPNCPLPKIPSAFVETPPPSTWPDHSPPMSPVEDAEKALAAISPIISTNGDFLFHIGTLDQFLQYVRTGILPNGKKTAFPLLGNEQLRLLHVPAWKWAPNSHDQFKYSCIEQIRMNMCDPKISLSPIGVNVQEFKCKLWDGFPPLSKREWAEKNLSDPAHFDIACEYLTGTITAFSLMDHPTVRSNMRTLYNAIWDILKKAEDSLNAQRPIRRIRVQSTVNLTGMWQEFIRTKYEVMTSVAHSWVLARAEELRKPLLPLIKDHKTFLSPSGLGILAYTKWCALRGITSMADTTIWMSMQQYKGFDVSPSEVIPGLQHPHLDSLTKKYLDIAGDLERKLSAEEALKEMSAAVGDIDLIVQKLVRLDVRGPSPEHPPPQNSLSQLILQQQAQPASSPAKDKRSPEFGLAIYRTAFGRGSNAKWDDMRRKIEDHLRNSLEQAGRVRSCLKLHWFITNKIRDVEAAKQHFLTTREDPKYKDILNHKAFLVVDDWSLASYTYPSFHQDSIDNGFLPADFQGHVLAVKADHEIVTPENQHHEALKMFDGSVRLHGDLIWPDLFPRLLLHSMALEDLWLSAMAHPLKVYTGIIVPTQRDKWLTYNALQRDHLTPYFRQLKEKQPELAAKMFRLKMPFYTH